MDKKPIKIFEHFKKKKVLVIGDVMVDAYMHGKVQRISPEAPVPVLQLFKQEQRLGGAANVAMNIQALGATPVLCSVVGDDEEGKTFARLLKEHKMPFNGIIKSLKRTTTVKHRILSESQHLLRIDAETTEPLEELDRKALLAHIKNLMVDCDLVIFEDYDKGIIDATVISETIALANKHKIPSAADPKKKNFKHYLGCTLFKPNLKELKEGLSIEFDEDDPAALTSTVNELHKDLKAENYLVTMGGKGVYFHASESKETGTFSAKKMPIADVSGAGDTVISIAGLALTAGLPLVDIAELSNLGGGIVCTSSGVTFIDQDKLREQAANKANLKKYV
ncbi:MAG: bifunctional ADP-heptose synthase [Bacteroidota bacterium]